MTPNSTKYFGNRDEFSPVSLKWASVTASKSATVGRPRREVSRAEAYARIFFFFFEGLAITAACRFFLRSRNRRIHESWIMLRSWVTRGVITPSGAVNERVFGQLSEIFKKDNLDSIVVPMFFNLDKGIFSEIRKIGRSHTPFLITEEFMSIGDHLRFCFWLYRVWNHSHFNNSLHRATCLGKDIVRLQRSTFGLRALKRKIHAPIAAIYPMENNAPEKFFILQNRRVFPGTKVIGFQHSMWYRNQPAMVISDADHPIPDIVWATGQRYVSILRECGFPQERIILTPSLRFHLLRKLRPKPFAVRGERELLGAVAFNYRNEIAIELLSALLDVAIACPHVRFILKAHPLNDLSFLKTLVERSKVKDRFSWSSQSVGEIFKGVDFSVDSGSSVTFFEAALLGLAVLKYTGKSAGYLDPLWDPYPLSSSRDSEELSKNIRLLEEQLENPHFQIELADLAEKFRNDYFQPLNAETSQIFLTSIRTKLPKSL